MCISVTVVRLSIRTDFYESLQFHRNTREIYLYRYIYLFSLVFLGLKYELLVDIILVRLKVRFYLSHLNTLSICFYPI